MSERRSLALSLFCALLDELPDGEQPEVEGLCAKHPELEEELRALRVRYRRACEALPDPPGGPVPEGEAPATERYTVEGVIAEGGMGRILRVWDAELRRPLAMKVLRRRGASWPGDLERRRSRLLNEAQILGQLEHPNIVPVHEVGRSERGELFFTMQLVAGRDLAEVIELARRGEEGWTTTRVVGVLQRVCEAVAHAHSKGVVHRDLKPANVMVGSFGEVYVMDWGLAKARGREGAVDIALREARVGAPGREGAALGDPTASVRTERRELLESDPESPLMTMEGDVVGTPAYMSPEQAHGRIEEVRELADVYGVGALLYHALVGRAPYEGPPAKVLEAARAGPPAPLSRVAPRTPAELVAICERAMVRGAGGRYASMASMAEDLRAYLEGRVVRAHAVGALAELRKWTARHRAVVGLAAALLVLLVGSSVVFAVLRGIAAERGREAAAAQFDALRRMNALKPLAPSGTQLPSFHEDFAGEFLDRRWMALGRTDLVSLREGRLRLESREGDMNTDVVLDPYVNVIEGDFDASVDFHLEGFDVPEFGADHAAVFSAIRADTGSAVIRIGRYVEEFSRETGAAVHTYRANANTPFFESDDMHGRLRLNRTGDRLTCFFLREGEGWEELHSRTFPQDIPLLLEFRARNWYTQEPFAVEFDDLHVETSFDRPVELLTELGDDFSDAAIDSRLVVRADAGYPAELDGKLYLEKIEGRRGFVSVGLCSWNWVMRGDCSVTCSFELDDFPLPEGGSTTLSLSFCPSEGGRTDLVSPMGAIQVQATPEGTFYRGFRHWGEAREELRGTTGRLRLERRGTDFVYLYWDEGWRELFVSPDIDTRLGLYFQIELRSSDPRAVLVAIDDLEVAPLVSTATARR